MTIAILSSAYSWAKFSRLKYYLFITFAHACYISNAQALDLEMQVSNARVTLSVPENTSLLHQRKFKQWISTSMQAVVNAYGEFPIDRVQVNIDYDRYAREPVPWATVIRDGIQGVHFYVNPSYPLKSFVNDWTAYHEFSHLLIPYPGRASMWFSEGLASYYQNILQARAGTISAQVAMQKLYDGFVRGTKDKNTGGLSLRKLSVEMKQRRSFMRVYWAGAAYFLNVDVALRQAGLPMQSLDDVLKEFKRCCLARDRYWSAKAIIDEFDRISGSAIFSSEYYRVIDRTRFPAYEHSFRALGIDLENTGRITINNRQPGSLFYQLVQGR